MAVLKRLFLLLSFCLSLYVVSAGVYNDTVVTIRMNAVGGLQYDIVRFDVKPGAQVRLILTNKDDMKHNLLITQPGSRLAVVDAALRMGSEGEKKSYIPEGRQILWSIPLLEPGESKTISFTAPQKEGVYPYVCTYPGHGQVMYGAMYVTREAMPALQDDANIPPGRRGKVDKNQAGHEGDLTTTGKGEKKITPPFLYRIFLPDAGPAAIAVQLTDSLSYCWDAGACRLRYAWYGGFLDNTDIWKGHHDAYGTIIGTVFYRDKTAYPLRADNPGNIPVVQFKGYRLIKKYPEFHYTINGIDVYELIKSNEKAVGLIRYFRIPKTERVIWFVFDKEDGARYQSSTGKWVDNQLKILPGEASEFTITMTKH